MENIKASWLKVINTIIRIQTINILLHLTRLNVTIKEKPT
jgi:hypothetical protein